MNPLLNVRFLVATIDGNDEVNRLAEGFLRGVAEHLLGRVIPGGDRAVEILAVDGDRRGVDDRRQVRRFVSAFVRHMHLLEQDGRVAGEGRIEPSSSSRPQSVCPESTKLDPLCEPDL